MIEVRNISKSFESKDVLKNVSANFERGKTNLIIGRSGSGKTVLLKCVVGLFRPEEGDILLDGKNYLTIKNGKEKKDIRKQIGMLFQGSALFDSLTVQQNVLFPLKMFSNMSNAEMNKRVDFCLERVGIKGAHKLMPSEISGGMQKRVAIARAISLNPKYLFCDEPNSGLDPKTSLLIDALIQDITHEFNITTVINTHDMNSVIEIGETIIFINEGVVGLKGSKDEVLKSGNTDLDEFIFASHLYKKIKDSLM